MSFPMMFYQRDIITKKKNLVPPSNPLPEAPAPIAEPAPKKKLYTGRVIVDGPDTVKEKVKTAPVVPSVTKIVANGDSSVVIKPTPPPAPSKPKVRKVVG